MDLKPHGLLTLFVLVSLLLEVQLRPVHRAPRSFSCEDDVEKTKKLSDLVTKQAEDLLNVYNEHIGRYDEYTSEDVPDSTVSGENFSERLLDIYAKDELFSLHLLKVKVYLEEILGHRKHVEEHLQLVTGSISNLLTRVEQILKELDPNTSLPPKPKPLDITHNDFAQKVYSWHVIDRVKTWGAQVSQVLEEGKKECKNLSAEVL